MKCVFCHDAEATETLHFCKACMNDPYVPSYQYILVGRHEMKDFSRWKEIWMEWFWVEGRKRYKNPLKSNGKPKKEKWTRLYCARSEEAANLLIRQIKLFTSGTSKKRTPAQEKEAALLAKFDDFRIVAPEITSKKQRRAIKQQAEDFRKTQATLPEPGEASPECPGCGVRDGKKVKKDGVPMWRCLSCGRRWPRTPREAPESPSKARKDDPGSSTPYKKEKGSKKGRKKVQKSRF